MEKTKIGNEITQPTLSQIKSVINVEKQPIFE